MKVATVAPQPTSPRRTEVVATRLTARTAARVQTLAAMRGMTASGLLCEWVEQRTEAEYGPHLEALGSER